VAIRQDRRQIATTVLYGSVIRVTNVAKTFERSVPALRDVSFAVPAGTVCALLGHNGAGKTTMVKILSTLLPSDAGRVLVAGYDVAEQPAQVRASIGVTGQEAALDLMLTGRENLVLFGRLRGLRRKEARVRADDLIDQFDMEHAADRQVFTYSLGMRRRIDIAAALVVMPRVLFLDEPTTGLDPRSRRDVWNLVSALAAEGVTVMLTTQYLEEADVLSDSIVILDHGRVVASGTAEELKRLVGFTICQVTLVDPADMSRIADILVDFRDVDIDPEANKVSVPAPDGAATLGEVFRRLDRHSVEVLDISLRKPSLDDVFLHLTPPAVTA
jgi:ABC-2 type transport system ATP-binding protein